MSRSTQVAIIGAGPGGYTAAFLAAGQGLEVTLIDPSANPGGTCLYRGCIPSKALLHAVGVLEESSRASVMGLHFAPPRIDLDRLRAWKDEVVENLTSGLGGQAKLRGVTFIQGSASFIDGKTLLIKPGSGESDEKITFEHCIIASGSLPSGIPGLNNDLPGVIGSTEALALADIPDSLLVVGGGNIGLELGSVYAGLGSKVTVVEYTAGLLPLADRDLVRPLAKLLQERFANILLNTRVSNLKSVDGGVEVEFTGKDGQMTQESFSRVLVATGRKPNIADLGLENTSVETGPGGVVVDERLRSSEERIWAVGDLTPGPMLAHKASNDAHLVVDAILGRTAPTRRAIIPSVTYTNPEVAWVGLTESEARKEGIKVKAARFPWAASGRGHTVMQTQGVTKLIFDPESEMLLGVGITGHGAGELIAEGVMALEQGFSAKDMAAIIRPHPTMSETMMEAAEVFLGKSVHFHAPRRR
ncbi:MAG: dihydrolipoyl dehydrogenase [Magnetococcales bacterium]|nr:dihydrolipoyl dehydrogenase [Magnetococcales bacterium]